MIKNVVDVDVTRRLEKRRAAAATHAAGDGLSASYRAGLELQAGPVARTLRQLRNEAGRKGLKGRSLMNKAQLEAALPR